MIDYNYLFLGAANLILIVIAASVAILIVNYIVQSAWNWLDDKESIFSDFDLWMITSFNKFYYRYPRYYNNSDRVRYYCRRSKFTDHKVSILELKKFRDYITPETFCYHAYIRTTVILALLPITLVTMLYFKFYVMIALITFSMAHLARFTVRLSKVLKKHIENTKIHVKE